LFWFFYNNKTKKHFPESGGLETILSKILMISQDFMRKQKVSSLYNSFLKDYFLFCYYKKTKTKPNSLRRKTTNSFLEGFLLDLCFCQSGHFVWSLTCPTQYILHKIFFIITTTLVRMHDGAFCKDWIRWIARCLQDNILIIVFTETM
jgi:hypothetical protein